MPVGDPHAFPVCHCGVMGHALNSINCPVHGQRVTQMDEHRVRKIVCEEIRAVMEFLATRMEGKW